MKVYQFLAYCGYYMAQCQKRPERLNYAADLERAAKYFVAQYGPSGSGIDCGTRFVKANAQRIVLSVDYHHMDDAGYYIAWTAHKITVRPTLLGGDGIVLSISGRNFNDVKNYLGDIFYTFFLAEMKEYTPSTPFNFVPAEWKSIKESIDASKE